MDAEKCGRPRLAQRVEELGIQQFVAGPASRHVRAAHWRKDGWAGSSDTTGDRRDYRVAPANLSHNSFYSSPAQAGFFQHIPASVGSQ